MVWKLGKCNFNVEFIVIKQPDSYYCVNASLMHTNLSTTTIGLSLPVATIRPFHIIRADETIIPKLRTWYKNWKQQLLHLTHLLVIHSPIKVSYFMNTSICVYIHNRYYILIILPGVCSSASHHQKDFETCLQLLLQIFNSFLANFQTLHASDNYKTPLPRQCQYPTNLNRTVSHVQSTCNTRWHFFYLRSISWFLVFIVSLHRTTRSIANSCNVRL